MDEQFQPMLFLLQRELVLKLPRPFLQLSNVFALSLQCGENDLQCTTAITPPFHRSYCGASQGRFLCLRLWCKAQNLTLHDWNLIRKHRGKLSRAPGELLFLMISADLITIGDSAQQHHRGVTRVGRLHVI